MNDASQRALVWAPSRSMVGSRVASSRFSIRQAAMRSASRRGARSLSASTRIPLKRASRAARRRCSRFCENGQNRAGHPAAITFIHVLYPAILTDRSAAARKERKSVVNSDT